MDSWLAAKNGIPGNLQHPGLWRLLRGSLSRWSIRQWQGRGTRRLSEYYTLGLAGQFQGYNMPSIADCVRATASYGQNPSMASTGRDSGAANYSKDRHTGCRRFESARLACRKCGFGTRVSSIRARSAGIEMSPSTANAIPIGNDCLPQYIGSDGQRQQGGGAGDSSARIIRH